MNIIGKLTIKDLINKHNKIYTQQIYTKYILKFTYRKKVSESSK